MRIRAATSEDLVAITSLFRGTVTKVNAKDYDAAQIAAWSAGADERARWQALVETQHFLVAEQDEQLLGFGSISITGYVDVLFVAASAGGRGVGTRLLAQLESYVDPSAVDSFTANVSITARPFFESRGYRVIREQRVTVRGVEFVNYAMTKSLRSA